MAFHPFAFLQQSAANFTVLPPPAGARIGPVFITTTQDAVKIIFVDSVVGPSGGSNCPVYNRRIEYGLDTNYGTTVFANNKIRKGIFTTPVQSGLIPDTEYFFKITCEPDTYTGTFRTRPIESRIYDGVGFSNLKYDTEKPLGFPFFRTKFKKRFIQEYELYVDNNTIQDIKKRGYQNYRLKRYVRRSAYRPSLNITYPELQSIISSSGNIEPSQPYRIGLIILFYSFYGGSSRYYKGDFEYEYFNPVKGAWEREKGFDGLGRKNFWVGNFQGIRHYFEGTNNEKINNGIVRSPELVNGSAWFITDGINVTFSIIDDAARGVYIPTGNEQNGRPIYKHITANFWLQSEGSDIWNLVDNVGVLATSTEAGASPAWLQWSNKLVIRSPAIQEYKGNGSYLEQNWKVAHPEFHL